MSDSLLDMLRAYVRQGRRVVMDGPDGAYDEHGKVLRTPAESHFESCSGRNWRICSTNNVTYAVRGLALSGFVSELRPTSARVVTRFDSGEPAVSENRVGSGTAVLLGWDASFAVFAPGRAQMEALLREHIL